MRIRKSTPLLLSGILALLLVVTPSLSDAMVLAQYSFEGTDAPSNVATDVSATSATTVRRYNNTQSFDGSSSAQWTGLQVLNDPFSPSSTALNFTISSSNPLMVLELSTITWQVQTESLAGSSHSTSTLLYYNLPDDALGWIDSGAGASAGTGANSISGWVQGSFDLSSLGQVDGISFRLAVRDGSNDPTDKLNRVDAIVINGAVVVPEPSRAILLGIGCLFIPFRRRRG